MSAGLDRLRRGFDQDPSDESARALARGLARAGAVEEAYFLLLDRGLAQEDPQLKELGGQLAADQRACVAALGSDVLCARRAPAILEEYNWAWESPRAFLAEDGRGPVVGLKFHRAASPEDRAAIQAFEALIGLDLEHALPEGPFAIEELARLPRLRYLNIAAARDSRAWLPRVGALSSLRSMVCRDLPVTAATLASWSGLTKLRHLDLTNTLRSPGDLALLSAFPLLETLDLCSTAVRDEDLDGLAALPCLRRLNLIATNLGDGAGAALARLRKLEELDLDYAALEDSGLAALASLASLRRLSLKQTRLTPASKPLFEALESLKDLCLTGTAIGGGAEAWSLPSGLVELDLGSSGTTDADLGGLAGLTALEELSLFSCPITDRGLASLSGLSALEELNLSFTPIDGSGLVHLSGLPALRRVRIAGCQVDRAALGAALPQVEDWD